MWGLQGEWLYTPVHYIYHQDYVSRSAGAKGARGAVGDAQQTALRGEKGRSPLIKPEEGALKMALTIPAIWCHITEGVLMGSGAGLEPTSQVQQRNVRYQV